MKGIFIDTSFVLALASPRDALYERSVMWRVALTAPFITTEFVLLEIADGFAGRRASDIACAAIESLRKDAGTKIISADSMWVARGYDLFRKRHDKSWGLTDCISFEVMRELNITDALTHDHHFEQAGFRALLREDPPSN